MPPHNLTASADTPAQRAIDHVFVRYPALATTGQHAELSAALRSYLESLMQLPVGLSPSLDCLVELAAISGDVAAPLVLTGAFAAAMDQLGVPKPASRSGQVRVMQDLAEAVRLHEAAATRRAAEQALQDPASGLPTRTALYRRIAEHIAGSRDPRQGIGVLCVQIHHALDRLGQPGHASHEGLLREVVRRLHGALQAKDLIGRTGDMEFTVLLPNLRSPGIAMLAANKIIRGLADPIDLGTDVVSLSTAVGIAIFPEHAGGPEALLECGVTAAREARHSGLELSVYARDSDASAESMVQFELELKQTVLGLQEGLALNFQPQLDLRSGAVQSVEALLRWERRSGEWVSPQMMVERSDDSGLIYELSKWILFNALRTVAEWRREGIDVSVGVNLLSKSLLSQDLAGLIRNQLGTEGVPADRLRIEVTEMTPIEDADIGRTLQTLQELKAIGVTIAIDDFGTGYSSWKWLRLLPFDELKVDQMFVRNLLNSAADEIMVRTAINMGHELGLVVVAEGVEDEATRDALHRMGCDLIQGYWLSRPLGKDACGDFLRKHAGQ
jgi:diguanylate cyclase (GGDEF)-like protein